VLGSRKLPVERDDFLRQRFALTRILLLLLSAFTPTIPLAVAVPFNDDAVLILLICTYLSFSSYIRDTRTCVLNIRE